MTDLSGRIILVTGASSGIGFETVRLLGAAGAHVIAQWRSDREGAEAATTAIPPERKHLIRADFTRPDSASDLWIEALGWYGRIDVVVNNAAVLAQAGVDDPDEDWARAWEMSLKVNLREPANLMRHATNHFRERGEGVLITVSSWAAQRGSANPRLVAYSATKAALAAATKTIAGAYAREGVLAYCIAPGVAETGMTAQSALSQGGLDSVVDSLTMKEMIPPGEIAQVVAFLSTGAVRHLTGATLDINGASYMR